jgi:hypothetical protein
VKTIRIQKAKLVEILQQNSAKHAAAFVEAAEAWRTAQRDKLHVAIAVLNSHEQAASFNFHAWHLPKPETHLEDYGRALRKLELSADDVIELTDEEYRQFVEDEWAWKRAFDHLVGTYAGAR